MSGEHVNARGQAASSGSDKHRSIEHINASMIRHARQLTTDLEADILLVYVNRHISRERLKTLLEDDRCVLAARGERMLSALNTLKHSRSRIIRLPDFELARRAQIKIAALMAISQGLVHRDNVVVFLSNSPESDVFDNLAVVDLKLEIEMFSFGNLSFLDHVKQPAVFEQLLSYALELTERGKRGKPLGTIFVLGDHEQVMNKSSQMILNPFSCVPEHNRNILDPELKETVWEFSGLDGAFIVRDDGVILAAGRYLSPSVETVALPQGLGSRHRSAAGITAETDAVAMVVSKSTDNVRIFCQGKSQVEI